MIIYTIFYKKNKKRFTKTFESPFLATNYRSKISKSKNLIIEHVIYDYL